MAFFALVIGVVLIVAAVRNSQDDLFTALSQDAPKFAVWAAAIVAVAALGYVPGLKPVSKLLIGLIILVIILNNYQQIVQGFQNSWQNPGASANSASSQGSNTAQPTTSSTQPPAANAGTNNSWTSIAQSLGAGPIE